MLDIPELRKLIERHHDGDHEPADPAWVQIPHEHLEDPIQVVFSGASKLSQVGKGWRRNPSEARFLVCGRNTPWSELTLSEALVYIQQQDGEHPPIALDLSAIYCDPTSLVTLPFYHNRLALRFGDPISDDDMLSIFSTRPHLQHLRLECDWVTDAMVRDIATHCTELRSLMIEPGDWAGYCTDSHGRPCDDECTEMITADSLLVLAKNCTHLRVLRLDLCRFDDAAALVLAENCRGLRVLSLKRGHDCFELGVGNLGVCAIAESCHQLESVDLETCQLTDTALLALARGCPQLKRLSVTHTIEHGAYSMTNVAVEALVKHCPQLATLELPGYWLFLEESCPRLQATLQFFKCLSQMDMPKRQHDYSGHRQCGLCQRREPTAFPPEMDLPFNSGQGQDGRGEFETHPPWHRYVRLTGSAIDRFLYPSSAKFSSIAGTWSDTNEDFAFEHTTLSFTREILQKPAGASPESDNS